METIREMVRAPSGSEEESTDPRDEPPQKPYPFPSLSLGSAPQRARGPPPSAPSFSTHLQPYNTPRRPYHSFQLSTQQYLQPPTRRLGSMPTFQPQPITRRSLPTFQPSTQQSFSTFQPSTTQSFPQLQFLRNRRVRSQSQDPQSYSQCTGNKKALIIGIDYADHPKLRLRRGIGDAYDMARFLRESERFKGGDIRILVDRRAQSGSMQQPIDLKLPNRENILEAIQWLVHEARKDDSLFFYFSGHIKQFKGVDGNDIGICAMDYRDGRTGLFRVEEPSGVISHGMMRDIMIQPLPPGCRLTAIFDSLNSGNFLNLPYVYSPYGVLEDNSVKHRDMQDEILTVADVISLGTCGGTEPPAGSSSGGSLGAAYMEVLGKRVTYDGLIQDLRNRMEFHSRQRPQLSSLHQIDLRFEFII